MFKNSALDQLWFCIFCMMIWPLRVPYVALFTPVKTHSRTCDLAETDNAVKVIERYILCYYTYAAHVNFENACKLSKHVKAL